MYMRDTMMFANFNSSKELFFATIAWNDSYLRFRTKGKKTTYITHTQCVQQVQKFLIVGKMGQKIMWNDVFSKVAIQL